MIMKMETYFDQIEGLEFMAYFAVMSGTDAFTLGLAHHPIMIAFINEIENDPTAIQEVQKRLFGLLSVPPNPQYYHPYDIAVAAYLYILSVTNEELAYQALSLILETPQLRWAKRLAKQIIEAFVPTVGFDASGSGQSEVAFTLLVSAFVVGAVHKSESEGQFLLVSPKIDRNSRGRYSSFNDPSKTGNSHSEESVNVLEVVRVAS